MKNILTRTFFAFALCLLCMTVAPRAAHAGLSVSEAAPIALSTTRLRVFADRAEGWNESWKQTLAALEWVETQGVTREASDAQIYPGEG